jgi:hypothetical protein
MSRYGRLQTLVVGFRSIFGFKKFGIIFNSRNKITENFACPPNLHLPTWEQVAPPYTFPFFSNLAHNLLSDQLWAPLL